MNNGRMWEAELDIDVGAVASRTGEKLTYFSERRLIWKKSDRRAPRMTAIAAGRFDILDAVCEHLGDRG